LAATANAQTLIGVSFNSGGGGQTPINPLTETAGFVPQLNFNVYVGDPTSATLNYDNGLSSGASITVQNYGNYFSSGSFTNPGDQHLFDSNLNHGDITTSNAGIAVSSIPFATYNLYVYASSDNNSPHDIMTYKLTQGASVQTLSMEVMSAPGTYVQGTSTYNGAATNPGDVPAADYVEFTGLTANSFTLQFGGQSSTGAPASFNAGLNGFQIQAAAVPEPSTWAMMFGGLAILGFCVRRKSTCSIN